MVLLFASLQTTPNGKTLIEIHVYRLFRLTYTSYCLVGGAHVLETRRHLPPSCPPPHRALRVHHCCCTVFPPRPPCANVQAPPHARTHQRQIRPRPHPLFPIMVTAPLSRKPHLLDRRHPCDVRFLPNLLPGVGWHNAGDAGMLENPVADDAGMKLARM